MSVRDLIPWSRGGNRAPSLAGADEAVPVLTLHREMNRLFDEALRGFDAPLPVRPRSVLAERGDRRDGPGDPRDGRDARHGREGCRGPAGGRRPGVRGEKRAETQDRERRFGERIYGRFERRIPLGIEVEEDGIAASFRNGVLTVTLPKSAKARERARRIPITAETRH